MSRPSASLSHFETFVENHMHGNKCVNEKRKLQLQMSAGPLRNVPPEKLHIVTIILLQDDVLFSLDPKQAMDLIV